MNRSPRRLAAHSTVSAFAMAIAAALGSTPAQAQSGGQRMNAGLWEHSFTIKSQSGRMEQGMKEMQQAMASMPPEQRRQMEAMLGQQGVGFGPTASTVKVCVSQQDAERDQPPPAQEGCTQTAQRNGKVWNVSFRCPGPPPSSGDGTITLQSATAYSGVMQLVTDVDGKPEKMQMTTAGKWLGRDCGNIKPVSR